MRSADWKSAFFPAPEFKAGLKPVDALSRIRYSNAGTCFARVQLLQNLRRCEVEHASQTQRSVVQSTRTDCGRRRERTDPAVRVRERTHAARDRGRSAALRQPRDPVRRRRTRGRGGNAARLVPPAVVAD